MLQYIERAHTRQSIYVELDAKCDADGSNEQKKNCDSFCHVSNVCMGRRVEHTKDIQMTMESPFTFRNDCLLHETKNSKILKIKNKFYGVFLIK